MTWIPAEQISKGRDPRQACHSSQRRWWLWKEVGGGREKVGMGSILKVGPYRSL